jgi:glycosyltransferase involved in cell wall biosynthesis
VWLGELQDKEMLETELKIEYSSRFHFLGELKNPYPVIRKARLLTVTSRAEASPLVTIEAQALGTPVVAFDVGDIRNQIPINHLVKADDEISLLQIAQDVLKSSSPVLKFDSDYNGSPVAKRRTLNFIKQNIE